ncbi:MAG: DNA cytosine methyltransferase [Rickettsiales bacterium]|jgi:DNA (cytosine-5)-methyltransferase 1|nr:DNA cytosine methyltransferase [Rickettsiales bacterium]
MSNQAFLIPEIQNNDFSFAEVMQRLCNVKIDKSFKVISLFSGAGGMDLGFKQAGFSIIFANDFDKDACETYRKNIDDNILNCDISKIQNCDIPNGIDVLIGGFPCQGFSIANRNRNIDDERNSLYKEMIRFIKISSPRIIVAENVKGILSLGGGVIFKQIQKDLQDLGYKVDYKLVNTAYFGVPQTRERVIIIANKLGIKNLFPQETHNESNFISTKEACEHLSNVNISYNPIKIKKDVIYNHIASTNVHDKFWGRKYDIKQSDICDYLKEWRKKAGISTKKIDDIFGYKHTAGHWFRKDNNSGSIPKPSDWWRLKEILKFDDKFDKQVTELVEKSIVFEQSLRITNWDKPSDTITATSPEIHINKERRLSVRECAIIQTFPDNFVFTGSLNSMYRQIGNAVPVKFANCIAKSVLKMLYESK